MSDIRSALDKVMQGLLTAIVALLLGLMSLQVVLRYGFGSSLIWAEEVCRYLLIWLTFLAGIYAYERGEIASVPILRDALPRVPGLALAMLANLCGVVLLGVLAWYGWIYAQRMGQSPIPAAVFILPAGSTPPGMFWIYIALPVGMVLMALRLLHDILLYARMMVIPGAKAADLRDQGEIGGHP